MRHTQNPPQKPSLLRKCVSYLISTILIIQPVWAAEISINQISSQPIQRIKALKPGQYAISLGADLWSEASMALDHLVTLIDQDESPLEHPPQPIGFLKRTLDCLVFQGLHNIHFHFFASDMGVLSSGPLCLINDGRLSFYDGEFKGLTNIEGQRIYLNKDPRTTNHPPITFGSQTRLTAHKNIINRTSLAQKTALTYISTPDFSNSGDIQAHKIILKIDKGVNQKKAILRTNTDITILGQDAQAGFTKFQNNGKLAAKTHLKFYGKDFEQGPEGISFAGLTLVGSLANYIDHGQTLASFLVHIHASQSMIFDKSVSQGALLQYNCGAHVVTKGMAKFKTRESLLLSTKGDLQGESDIQVASTSHWSFPFHLYYEDAEPKGKRATKLRHHIQEYLRSHPTMLPQNAPPGFHLQVGGALTLGGLVDIVTGQTKIKSTLAKFLGHIIGGSNQHGAVTLNAQNMNFLGDLEAFQSEIIATDSATLSGLFSVNDLTLLGNSFVLTGQAKGDNLTTETAALDILTGASVLFPNLVFNNQQTSIAGCVEGRNLLAKGHDFRINTHGHVSSHTADFDVNIITINGQGTFNQSKIKADQVVVGPQGILKNKDTLTNKSPNWNVYGTANIGHFSSAVPLLTLSGSDTSTFNLYRASIQCDTTHLYGSLHLGGVTLYGNTLNLHALSNIHGGSWALYLASRLNHDGALTLGHLNLTVPHWEQSSTGILDIGSTDLNISSVVLKGEVRGRTFAGIIQDLFIQGKIHPDRTDLQGRFFKNQGQIHSPSGIRLMYETYPSLGALTTHGVLALKLDDRVINDPLLCWFESAFGYKILSLTTNQPLMFRDNLTLNKGLTLSALSIIFDNTSLRQFKVNGDLILDSRNGSLIINNFDIMAKNLTPQSVYNLILNGSSLQAQALLHLAIQGNVILNRTNRPSLLSGGTDGLTGEIGGKLINNISDIFSHSVIGITARQGFEFHAQEIHHRESHMKRTHWGFGKKTATREWSEIISPTIGAAGPIKLISSEGGAHFDSTKMISPYRMTVATEGPVTNLERITYDNAVTKKNTPWSRKRIETKTQGDSPTVMVSMEGVDLISWNDKIDLPNTVVMAPRVLLDGYKDVRLTLPTLRSEYFFESSGLTFSHALSAIINDPMRTMMNMDSIMGSLMSLYDAHSQHPVNQVSAGMMAGINGYNAYKGYQKALTNGGTLGTFATSRLLSNLFQVQIGYHDLSHSGYQITPGQGGVFAGEATIRSREGDIHTLNGVPLDVEKLTVSCLNGSWFREGFKSEFGGSSESFNRTMGISLLTMTPSNVSLSASSSEYTGIRWIPQQISDKNPTVEAKSVMCLDGADSFHQSQSSFGVSMGPSSFGMNIEGYGFSYATASRDGMLGSIGIQVKGMNFVVPVSEGMESEKKQEQPVVHPIESHSHDLPKTPEKTLNTTMQPTKKSGKTAPQIVSEREVPKDLTTPSESLIPSPSASRLTSEMTLRGLILIYPGPMATALSHFQKDKLDDPLTPELRRIYEDNLFEDASDYAIGKAAWEFYGKFLPTNFFTKNPLKILIIDGLKEIKSCWEDGFKDPLEHLLSIHGAISNTASTYTSYLKNRLETYYSKGKAFFRPLKELPDHQTNLPQLQNGTPHRPLLPNLEPERKLLTHYEWNGKKLVSNAGGKVMMFATPENRIFYRVYSENPKGRFLTSVPPSSKYFAEHGLALPSENSATFIQEVFVPKGVFVQRSRALPAFDRPGGVEQFEILNTKDFERVIFGAGNKLK